MGGEENVVMSFLNFITSWSVSIILAYSFRSYYRRTLQKKKNEQRHKPWKVFYSWNLSSLFSSHLYCLCVFFCCRYRFILRTIDFILNSWSVREDKASNSISDVTGIFFFLNCFCSAPCISDFSVVLEYCYLAIEIQETRNRMSRKHFFQWKRTNVSQSLSNCNLFDWKLNWLSIGLFFHFLFSWFNYQQESINKMFVENVGSLFVNRIPFYLFTGVRFYLPVSLAFTINSACISIQNR